LQAFDERAKTWTVQRRRMWRAVWRSILASAGDDGVFDGDVARLADSASDRLGADIADETVAKVLRLSVASQLTVEIRTGRTATYRIRQSPEVRSPGDEPPHAQGHASFPKSGHLGGLRRPAG